MSDIPITQQLGLGVIPQGYLDYVSKALQEAYLKSMATIYAIMTKPYEDEDDIQALQQAIKDLKKILLEGDSTSSPPSTFYLTPPMQLSVELTLWLLQTAGITENSVANNDPIAALQKLHQLKNEPISNFFPDLGFDPDLTFVQYILQSGKLGESANLTTQQCILQLANQLSTDYGLQLDSLNDQLEITKAIMSNLTILQNIANRLIIPDASKNVFPPIDDSVFASMTEEQIKAIVALFPTEEIIDLGKVKAKAPLTLKEDFMTAYQAKLDEAQALLDSGQAQTWEQAKQMAFADSTELSDIIKTALEKNPDSYTSLYKVFMEIYAQTITPIVDKLTNDDVRSVLTARNALNEQLKLLEAQGVKATDVNSAAYFLKKVIDGIDEVFMASGAGIDFEDPNYNFDLARAALSTWILDGQDSSSTGTGVNQTNLQQAMAAISNMKESVVDKLNEANTWWQTMQQSLFAMLKVVSDMIVSSARGIRS